MTTIWDTCLYDGGTLIVLLALADWANDDGTKVHPSIQRLAAKSRLSVRGAQLCLERLRKDKVLVTVSAVNDEGKPIGGRSKATEYKIDLERVQVLQGIHEDQKGCSRCNSKPKKGCNQTHQKGEDGDGKGEERSAHIDNHQEPSNEPSLSQARESESGFEKLAEGFRKWPGLPPSWSEPLAEQTWRSLSGDPPDDELLACIEAHGCWLAAENARRKPSDPYRTGMPHNWLRERKWRGYLAEIRDRPKRIAEGMERGNALRAQLGEAVFERLASVLKPSDIEEWFQGARFEAEPVPRFTIPKPFRRDWIASRYGPRLERAFGGAVRIDLAENLAA